MASKRKDQRKPPWLPMRLDLAEDPRTVAIALACGADPVRVCGCLYAVWARAKKQCNGCRLKRHTLEMIDALVHLPGFAAAMAREKLLVIEEDGLRIPNAKKWLLWEDEQRERWRTYKKTPKKKGKTRTRKVPKDSSGIPTDSTKIPRLQDTTGQDKTGHDTTPLAALRAAGVKGAPKLVRAGASVERVVFWRAEADRQGVTPEYRPGWIYTQLAAELGVGAKGGAIGPELGAVLAGAARRAE